MKKIAIIPARSGSKGLPNKNVLMLGDKPLIAYSIEAALDSKCFERVIVSTDSLEYRYVAEKFGAEVILRDEKLSSDTTSSFMVIEDVLYKLGRKYDYFMLLQPTSPFRTSKHIEESIQLFEKKIQDFDFLVSMEKNTKPSILIKQIEEDQSLKAYDMDFSGYVRQKYREFIPNGAIYIGKINEYLEKKHFFGNRSVAYFMSKEDSVDIDDKLDFEIAISILANKNKEKTLKKNIRNKIIQKSQDFNKKCDIVLIGHSILDNWEILKFQEYSINNLGISGISTLQYQKNILDKNLIMKLPKYIFLMLGTNDIVDFNLTNQDIVMNINKFIYSLYKINPKTKIFFIEIPSVIFRMDRNKNRIFLLNSLLRKNLDKSVTYVEINKYMTDSFGNLKLEYTYDGLHFSEEGYRQLEEALKKEIKL